MSRTKKTKKKASKAIKPRPKFSRGLMWAFVAVSVIIGVVVVAHSLAYRTVGISNGSIYAFCSFSHRANDDPIVFPGRPGASHSHDFFGATNLSAFSTNDSIRQSSTSCHRTQDKSAYWVPTLYFKGQPVNPKNSDTFDPTNYRITAVYGGDHQVLKYMQPYPAGLRMIVGSASGGSAMTPNRNEPVWFWLCRNSTYISQGDANTAPTCSESSDPKNFPQYLQLRIHFPSCWDGVHLDSPDHKSHMAFAYQQGGNVPANRCPSTHPVQLPNLDLDIGYYGVTGGPDTRFSSGDASTVHADFMNGWDQTRLTELVNICLKRDVYCGGGEGPAVNHNNEPEDTDASDVQAYLNSAEGRKYIAQAERAYPQPAPIPVNQQTNSRSKAANNSNPSTAGSSSSSAQTGAMAGMDMASVNPHSLQAAMHKGSANRYTVSVKVIDQNKKPVKGAKVTLNHRLAISDYKGIAGFSEMAAGEYPLVTTALGDKVTSTIQVANTGTPVKFQAFSVQVKDKQRSLLVSLVVGLLAFSLVSYRVGVPQALIRKITK